MTIPIVLSILAAGAIPGDLPVSNGRQGTEAAVIVGFNGRPSRGLIQKHGGRIRATLQSPNAMSAAIPPDRIAALASEAEVAYVEEDGVGSANAGRRPSTARPPAQETPWGIARIGAPPAWVRLPNPATGREVRVAILDTGIDDSHPDFKDGSGAGRVLLGPCYVPGTAGSADDYWHGTHVAGTVGASNNSIGVVGVAPECTLVAVKVLDSTGFGYYSWWISGIDWAVSDGCRVVNMSLSGLSYSTSLQESCDRAVAAGTIVVAAAGNHGDTHNSPEYPAAHPSVIAVGATDATDARTPWSTHGPQLDIAAPGANVRSTVPTWMNGGFQGYGYAEGTSMAAPHVSGAIAMTLSSGFLIDLNWNGQVSDELLTMLNETADDVNAAAFPGRDDHLGIGLVDAFEAASTTMFTYDPNPPSFEPPATLQPPSPDATPPHAVINLRASLFQFQGLSAQLEWTATGDDGGVGAAAAYEVRFSTAEPLNDENWFSGIDVSEEEPFPMPAGSYQWMTVGGLVEGQAYWFAIRVVDDAGNWSPTSNNAIPGEVPSGDVTPPAAITTLSGSLPSFDALSIDLTWTSTGDDGTTGAASAYDVRYSTSDPLNNTNWNDAAQVDGEPTPPLPAGRLESMSVGGLLPGQTYWFAIRAVDEAGNWSDISDNVTVTTFSE